MVLGRHNSTTHLKSGLDQPLTPPLSRTQSPRPPPLPQLHRRHVSPGLPDRRAVPLAPRAGQRVQESQGRAQELAIPLSRGQAAAARGVRAEDGLSGDGDKGE